MAGKERIQIISKFNRHLKEYHQFKSLLDTHAHHMVRGNYKFSLGKKRLLFLAGDERTHIFLQTHFSDSCSTDRDANFRTVLKKKARSLVTEGLTLKNFPGKGGQGSIAMISRDADRKVFDLINEKVTTFYAAEQKFYKYIRDAEYFSEYFFIPFLEAKMEVKAVSERLITGSGVQLDKEDKVNCYRCLIHQYASMFADIQPEDYLDIDDLISGAELTFGSMFKAMKGFYSASDMPGKVPVYYMHSDLHFGNILIEGNAAYLIDWEHSSFKPFYYDVFNLLFIEIINYSRIDLVSMYFEGCFDKEFDILFKHAGMNFNKDCRYAYFLHAIFYRLQYFEVEVREDMEGIKNRYGRLLKHLDPLLNRHGVLGNDN